MNNKRKMKKKKKRIFFLLEKAWLPWLGSGPEGRK
jgi:hypothetical protein